MGFLPFDQTERIARYAAAHNVKNVGAVAPASDYGRTVIPAWQTMANRLGIHSVQTLSVPPTASFDASVKQYALSQSGLDAVFMPWGGSSATSVSNALNNGGLLNTQVKRIGTGLFDDPALASNSALEGAWFAAPSPRLRMGFEQRYRQTYGVAAPRLATLAYDATALASALAQRGLKNNSGPAFDRASITDANGFAGLDGIFRFRQNGMAERGLAVLEYRAGKIVVVDDAPATFQPVQY
jgi:ABC-type branched-subunit amino acid transport system substrate-binding protein